MCCLASQLHFSKGFRRQRAANAGATGIEMANPFRPHAWRLPSKTVQKPETSAVQKGAGEKNNKSTCVVQTLCTPLVGTYGRLLRWGNATTRATSFSAGKTNRKTCVWQATFACKSLWLQMHTLDYQLGFFPKHSTKVIGNDWNALWSVSISDA